MTYGSDHGRQGEPESESYSQRVVSSSCRRAREYRAYSNRRPAEDQDEGPDELGYGRSQDVGCVYLAAVESSTRLFLLLLVDGPPRAPADALFQTRFLFRAKASTTGSTGPGHHGFSEGVVCHAPAGLYARLGRGTLRTVPA